MIDVGTTPRPGSTARRAAVRRRVGAARSVRSARLGRRRRRASGGRGRRRRADAGPGRRRTAHDRDAAQEHGHRGNRAASWPEPMLRVALTGGIATGKSYCLQRFEALGAASIDADLLARAGRARRTRRRSRRSSRRFGRDVLLAGRLAGSRRARANRIRRPPRPRRSRIHRPSRDLPPHPRVVREPAGQRRASRSPISRCVFETGHQHDFDRIVVAACEPQEQIRRMIDRNGLSEAEARARLAAQWPIAEKVARAHYVIRTDGGVRGDGSSGSRSLRDSCQLHS